MSVFLVINTESGDEEVLGEYLGTDEDAVEYLRPDGSVTWAPWDCVRLEKKEG